MSKTLQEALLTRRTSPRRFVGVAIALTGLLASLLVVIWLATLSPRNIWAPRVVSRAYAGVPLSKVVSELETDGIIPAGSTWARPELKRIPVTVKLRFLSPDFEVLQQIAVATRTHVQVPLGHHGEIEGPARIREVDVTHPAGAWGHHYRLPSP